MYIPSMHDKRVLPRNNPVRNSNVSPGCEAPASRPKRRVEHATILDLGQVDDAVGLDLNVLKVHRRL